jgi:hypothetical protein
MQLDDDRTALAERADQVPAGEQEPREVLARAHRTVRRRRVGRAVAGVAVVLVVALVVVAVVATGGASKRVVVSATSTTIVPPTSLSAEQLDAHTGVGVPAGWAPVDSGDARLFVPADWDVETSGTCFGGPVAGLVSVGKMPMVGCTPADQYPVPEKAVAILPASKAPLNGGKPTLVHGYFVYVAEPFNPLWSVHVIPDLGIKIETRGELQDEILATLAPSAQKVALDFAHRATPAGRAYAGDGLSMTIPNAWSVSTPQGYPCYGFGGGGGGPGLERIEPGIGIPSCPAMLPTAANQVGDGLYVFTAKAFAPDPGPTPLAVLHHDDTTIRVFAASGSSNTLDLFVQRSGSATVHVLTLGLGRDGRVAGGVLSSIEATS